MQNKSTFRDKIFISIFSNKLSIINALINYTIIMERLIDENRNEHRNKVKSNLIKKFLIHY